MAKKFPVGFNFTAFETISRATKRAGRSIDKLKSKTGQAANKFTLFQKKTESARKSLTKFGNKATQTGKTLTAFATLPILGIGAAMVKTASDAEETQNKFDAVFKGIGDSVKKAALTDLTQNFKLADSTAQEFLGTTGQILQGFDFTQQKSLEVSTTLIKLSQDVASFRNVQGGAKQVNEAFTKALLGEREMLKSLGIAILESDVKAEALRMAQQGVRFETVKQAKALATLSLIQQKTTQDQGDFQRTQKGLANRLRINQERIKGVSERFGKTLLPVAEKVLNAFEKIISIFEKMDEETRVLVVTIAGIVAALGPVLILIGAMSKGVSVLITVFGALKTVTFAALIPFIKFIAIGAAVAALAFLIIKNWEKIKEFFVKLWDGPLVRVLRWITGIEVILRLGKLLISAWEPVKNAFMDFGESALEFLSPVIKAVEKLVGFGGKLAKLVLFGDADAPVFGDGKQIEGKATPGDRAQTASKAQLIGKSIAKEIRTVNDARVRMDFNNVPKGTSVSSSASGVPPEMNLGFSGAAL